MNLFLRVFRVRRARDLREEVRDDLRDGVLPLREVVAGGAEEDEIAGPRMRVDETLAAGPRDDGVALAVDDGERPAVGGDRGVGVGPLRVEDVVAAENETAAHDGYLRGRVERIEDGVEDPAALRVLAQDAGGRE